MCVLFPFSSLHSRVASSLSICFDLSALSWLATVSLSSSLFCSPTSIYFSACVHTSHGVFGSGSGYFTRPWSVACCHTPSPLSLSLCLTSPTGLKSFTATDNEMFYDFSMFTPSPLLPSSPVLPLSRLALWQGQRQNYAHFQIHLNTRNCCCCSGAWHAFKICSLQNVCPHRDRDGDRDRKKEREGGRQGNNLFGCRLCLQIFGILLVNLFSALQTWQP